MDRAVRLERPPTFRQEALADISTGGPRGGERRAAAEASAKRPGAARRPQRGRVHFHNLAIAHSGVRGAFVSRGVLSAAARPRWNACAAKLMCGDADRRVSTCIFNLGVQISRVRDPGRLLLAAGGT